MKIKPNCKKCYFSVAYYANDCLAACDSARITEPTVTRYDNFLKKECQCVKRAKWDEECKCEQFIPSLSEADGDYELEEEIRFNTSFDCPFCGEEIDVYDVQICDTKLVRCDECGKLMAVDGGDY